MFELFTCVYRRWHFFMVWPFKYPDITKLELHESAWLEEHKFKSKFCCDGQLLF